METVIYGNLQSEALEVILREGRYFLRYDAGAHQMAWREDVRLLSIGERAKELVQRISACGLSPSWRGYWTGVQRKQELLFWRGSWANSQFLSDQIPTGA